MKTYKDWEKSGIDLDDYLGANECEIDEELCMYLAECVAPNYSGDNGILQTGEATKSIDDTLYFLTVQFCEGGKYKYLGCLSDMDA